MILMFFINFTPLSSFVLYSLSNTILFLVQTFDVVSSYKDKVVSSNISANIIVFEAFRVHHKNRLI